MKNEKSMCMKDYWCEIQKLSAFIVWLGEEVVHMYLIYIYSKRFLDSTF